MKKQLPKRKPKATTSGRSRAERKDPGRPGRARWRPGVTNDTPSDYETFLVQDQEKGSTPFKAFRWNAKGGLPPPSYARMKLSERWVHSFNPCCRKDLNFPFISRYGKMTSNTVFRMRCHPLTQLASISSTIYKRLFSISVRRHGMHVAKSHREIILKVSAAHAISSDPWIVDRFLGASRYKKGFRKFRGVLSGFVSRLDDDQRFVHLQVCSQTNWITSLAERPSDKSRSLAVSNFDYMTSYSQDCSCENFRCPYGGASVIPGAFPRRDLGKKIVRDLMTPSDLRPWSVVKSVRSEPTRITGVVRNIGLKRPRWFQAPLT